MNPKPRAALLWFSLVLPLLGCQPQGSLWEECTDAKSCEPGLSCFRPRTVTQSDSCISSGLALAGPGPFCQRLCEVDADCAGPWGEGACARVGCPGSDSVCFRRGDAGAVGVLLGGDR